MLQVICMSIAWSLILVVVVEISAVAWRSWMVARAMHRIPCWSCQYYSGDPHLKCTVHPAKATTTSAIGCQDFDRLPSG